MLLFAAPGFSPLVNSAGRSSAELVRLEQQVYRYVNKERRIRRIPELNWYGPIAQEARRHAANIAQGHFFAHEDPLRGDVDVRLEKEGIQWRRCAENLYEGAYPDPARNAVQSWLLSSGHRRNILDAQFSDTGVGVAQRGDDAIIIVQEYVLK